VGALRDLEIEAAHAALPDTELMHLYGATETAPIATVLPHEERFLGEPQIRSCGQPAVGVEIAIVDQFSGAELPAGEVGEVAIRGDNVMAGYWRKPEATAAVLRDGWYRSGDLGYLDEHAYGYLVDRAKDMIVSGGEHVYSPEVEEALYRHESVLEAAVFAVPDTRWGEAVYAVVVPRGEVGEQELRQHCRTLIADYKVPKRIEFRTEPLPKSGAGKVLKRTLRDPHWEGESEKVGGG
jgi:long-chain acyl-CoA synthetase